MKSCTDIFVGDKNRSTKFDVLSAWIQNGVGVLLLSTARVVQSCVDKIDIRKSIISRTERVTNPSHNCVPKFYVCVCVFFFFTLYGISRFSRSSTIAIEAAVRCCALLNSNSN